MGCQASTTQHVAVEEIRKVPTASFSSSRIESKASTRTEELQCKDARIEECYDIQERLGAGSFAEVFACVSKKTQLPGAVKILEASSSEDKKKATRELAVWRKVGNHDNVVPLLEDYMDGDTFYYIMPRCQCSIADKFKSMSSSKDHNDMLDAFHQVFLGLQHCHSVNVMHRDIKAANLLVDFHGKVRIADFGLSISKPAEGITGLVGSVPYMSPEMVKGRKCGFETDIWSCGVVAYTLLYGHYPYEATSYQSTKERKTQIVAAIAKNYPAPDYEPENLGLHPSASVRAFIETLLERKPQLRPDATLCTKLCLSAKAILDAVEQEGGNAFAFDEPKVLKEDDTGASLATTCPTDTISLGGLSSHAMTSMSFGGASRSDLFYHHNLTQNSFTQV